MLSNLGNTLLVLVLLLSFAVVYSSINNLKESGTLVNKVVYNLSLFQSTLSILAFFSLIAAFIISDFSISNVFENSHRDKPLFYKIAGTWGNHEGSLLLWVNILIIFSFLFLIQNIKRPKNFRLLTLIIQNILIIGFLVFLLLNSNPFSAIYPIPKEGLGLNPILQDPALAIHPPLLYVGFVGSSIYFSAAMASLISDYDGKLFAETIKKWIFISWSFQTTGIILGSIWAYYELGWGGFWFWDPVENASLMPWFVMTALIHSVVILEKRNTGYQWVIILCLLAFTLSVTGTFLVRSGILNSVHTFANDPSRGLYILVFLSLMIFSAIIVFFKYRKSERQVFNINSKETYIFFNNWLMTFFLVTVLIGTIYPIFTEVISNVKISVGPPFYNIVLVPFVVPILILMSIGPNVKWIKNNSYNLKGIMVLFFVACLINLFIYYTFKSYSTLSNIIIISSLFLALNTFVDLKKILKKKEKGMPRIVSHLGFAMLVFFIAINHNYSNEYDLNLRVGEKKEFKNYRIEFVSLKKVERKNYDAVVGSFFIYNLKKNLKENLSPEIRVYSNPETLTYEASIKTKFTHDTYITMSNISRSEYYNIKFQHKPFMVWIWISAFMISAGGFINFSRKKTK